MGSPIIIGLRADSKSRGFFGERMRTDVSRETSRLTGMRTAPTSRAGTLRRPRIRIGNPRASPRGGRGSRASRGAPVGGGGDASRGAGRPATPQGPLHRNPPKAGAKEKTQQRLGLTVMGRQPRGGPAAAFGPNGLAPASPAEGREAGRQRTHAMHDYRGLPTEERRETPGRKKWRWRRIVHSARSLPCAGKRSVAGRSPARVPSCAPLQRVRMFHVKHSG